jgi:putative endopeptidase
MVHPARRALAALLLLGAAGARPADAQARALGIDTTSFDRKVRPQDDFFRFVNGGWLSRTEIPADASSWGAFNELSEASRNALHTILDDAASDRPAATVVSNAPGAARATAAERRKVGDLYASFMDSARVESLGIAPLQPARPRLAGRRSACVL